MLRTSLSKTACDSKRRILLDNSQLEKRIDTVRHKLGQQAVSLYILSRQLWVEKGNNNLSADELVDSIDESILMREVILRFANANDFKRLKDSLGEEFDKYFMEK